SGRCSSTSFRVWSCSNCCAIVERPAPIDAVSLDGNALLLTDRRVVRRLPYPLICARLLAGAKAVSSMDSAALSLDECLARHELTLVQKLSATSLWVRP